MKLNKLILSTVACALMLTGCDDQKMDWGKPDGHGDVTLSDIPLELAEKLANYDYIKAYAAKYAPNMLIGIGLGADFYADDDEYKKVVDDNFQMITTGNAMKHASVVSNSGLFNFATIDKFLAVLPAEMKVYGHAFVWHTQQRASYLNSLIAPEVIVDSDGNIMNVIDNYDFEAGNITGWGAYSSAGAKAVISAAGEGCNSNYAMKLTNPVAGANYSAQAYYTLPAMAWEVGATYVYSAYVYSEEANLYFQMQLQNRTTYSGVAYQSAAVPAGQWFLFEKEFEMTQEMADKGITHLTIDFGSVACAVYIDNIQFGKKKADDPDAGRINLLANGKFDAGISNWSKYNGPDGCNTYNETDGNLGAGCLQVVNPADNTNGEWKVQIHADLTSDIISGTTFYVSYYIKTVSGTGSARMSTTSTKAQYQQNQVITQAWTRMEWIATAAADITGVNFDLGLTAGTYLIDDVVVSTDPFNVTVRRMPVNRGITYIEKTDEQKKQIITGAMETWIKTMLDHCKDRVIMWDVLNEPVADNGQLRGIEYLPTELGDQEFYWGQYMGKNYAVKAFQFARQYGNATDKLFINDYNLETNPTKLAKLIEYVNYIDQTNGSPIVDGIGTQMHVTASSITREQIDDMFKAMAATGKLVRVTELDVRVNTLTPSAAQLAQQAEVYQWIAESFRENVPVAQQSGITIWSLTDAVREHEYWLPDDAPNLFDKSYGRKHAYKGFCDGLAGYDISTDFTGNDWVTGKDTSE